MFRNIIRKIRGARFKYEHLVEVRVSAGAIRHNYDTFQGLDESIGVAPVLKANAYGHGLVEVAKILDSRPLFLAVDSYHEALILRNEGIRSPLVVLGYTRPETILTSRLKNVAFTIVSATEAHELARIVDRTRSFHLKVDTGMHRQGVRTEDLDRVFSELRSNPRIKLEGACSHLADPDGESGDFTEAQISVWNDAVKKIRVAFPGAAYFHVAQTAGSAFRESIDANVMRLGLGLYGIDAKPGRQLGLRPAMEIWTIVATLRTVYPGERIGYNGTYTVPKETMAATIPMGYAEGIDRRLSNKGIVKVNGVFCPIIGRVSMDITSIDVGACPGVKLRDEVQVVSSNPKDPNSIESIAAQCGTITHDYSCRIPAGLRRVVV